METVVEAPVYYSTKAEKASAGLWRLPLVHRLFLGTVVYSLDSILEYPFETIFWSFKVMMLLLLHRLLLHLLGPIQVQIWYAIMPVSNALRSPELSMWRNGPDVRPWLKLHLRFTLRYSVYKNQRQLDRDYSL